MQAAGNDYVYIDCTKETVDNPSNLATKMSNRNYGIGSDGLILIKKGNEKVFEMEMYNPDGTLAEMCGNGLRCVVKYLYDEKLVTDKEIEIKTGAGILTGMVTEVNENDMAESIRINMGKPKLNVKDVPLVWKGDKAINQKLPVHGTYMHFTALSMGNPHCVIFLADKDGLQNLNIKHYGKEIENLDIFPNRTNVEFACVKNDGEVYQRTWERGTGETLACGTGASAVVVAGILNGLLDRNKIITNNLKGGTLKIEWSEKDDCVYLEGNAIRVFNGDWLL